MLARNRERRFPDYDDWSEQLREEVPERLAPAAETLQVGTGFLFCLLAFVFFGLST